MRIGNAVKYADKILDFVKGLSESDSSFYDKTRDKLLAISELCSEVQAVIKTALETTPPRNCTVKKTENTDEKITVLDNRVDTVEEKVDDVCAKIVKNISFRPAAEINTKYPDIIQNASKSNSDKTRITPKDAKKVLHIYAKVLENASTEDHNNMMINRCCGIIWKWFESRILIGGKRGIYNYDVRNLKDYIAGFVISFGHHIKLGNFDSYADRIERWLAEDKKFLLPYEVNKVCEGKETKFANTESMVLWEYLCQKCDYENLGKISLSFNRIGGVSGLVHHNTMKYEDKLGKGGIYTNKFATDFDNYDILDILERYNIM